MRDWRTLLSLAALVIFVSLFHARGIAPGQTFLPVDLANNLSPWRDGPRQPVQNPLITDPLFEFYPYLDFSVTTLRDTGTWPHWNPHMFLGYPASADPNSQSFYPFYLLLGLLLGPARAQGIGPWLHGVVAAFLVYGYMRTMQRSQRAALLAGFVYALSGQMVTWFSVRQWTGTLTWLPGVLWALELFLARRRLRYLALAALCLGLAGLSGQFQIMAFFCLFLGVYIILRTLEERRRGRPWDLWPLVAVAFVAVVGILLSAVQLVPLVEYLGISHRTEVNPMRSALMPQQLMTLLIPDFYGNPATGGEYWGQFNYAEATIYGGVTVLLLAVSAPFLVRKRRFFVAGLAILAVAVVYFVIGGPGVQLLMAAPVLRRIGLARSAFILPLLAAIMAGFAMDEDDISMVPAVLATLFLAGIAGLALSLNWGNARDHQELLGEPYRRMAILLAAGMVILLMRTRLPALRHWMEWAFVGLVLVDLFLYGSRFNPAGPIDQLFPSNEATEYLQANAGEHRVAPYMPGLNLAFGPNVLSTFGLSEPGGYSSLVPSHLLQLFTAGDPQGRHWNMLTLHSPPTRLLDIFQVGHVASTAPLADPEVGIEVSRVGCVGSTEEVTASSPVSGSFTVRGLAINRLGLQFRKQQEQTNDAVLLIRMWQGPGRDRLVLQTEQNVADLADRQRVTYCFAPEENAPGQTYVWEVIGAEGDQQTGVSLCTLEDGEPALAVYGKIWDQVYEDGIYYRRRLAPMPRAYVVYGAQHEANNKRAVARLLDESFDLRNSALVFEPIDLPELPPLSATAATIVVYQPNRVVVEAVAAQSGLLILGDLYHPGWRVKVDGQPADLLRANHVMRGILLPAGEHRVEYRFAPTSLWIGGLLSLLAVLILIAMVAVDGYRQRRGLTMTDQSSR